MEVNYKCNDKQWCKWLDERLNDGYHGKGFCAVDVVHHETGTVSSYGVRYRTSSKDKGLMLNFCPFCGERIFPKQENHENGGQG